MAYRNSRATSPNRTGQGSSDRYGAGRRIFSPSRFDPTRFPGRATSPDRTGQASPNRHGPGRRTFFPGRNHSSSNNIPRGGLDPIPRFPERPPAYLPDLMGRPRSHPTSSSSYEGRNSSSRRRSHYHGLPDFTLPGADDFPPGRTISLEEIAEMQRQDAVEMERQYRRITPADIYRIERDFDRSHGQRSGTTRRPYRFPSPPLPPPPPVDSDGWETVPSYLLNHAGVDTDRREAVSTPSHRNLSPERSSVPSRALFTDSRSSRITQHDHDLPRGNSRRAGADSGRAHLSPLFAQCEMLLQNMEMSLQNMEMILQEMEEENMEEQDMEEQNMEDVPIVPTGRQINVFQYTTPVSNSPADATCAICKEDATEGTNAGLVKLHVCEHAFHAHCMNAWMNSRAANSNKCPVCRKIIFRKQRVVRPAFDDDEPRLPHWPIGSTYHVARRLDDSLLDDEL